jgi:hypothetical protein
MHDDAGTTGRWMTYDELAEMRGIKRIGAVRLVQRYKWRRQAGNDGRARVLVPHDALAPVRGTDAGSSAPMHVTPTSAGNGSGTDAGTMLAGALAALEDAVTGLRGQLDVANARAERAEAAIADAASDVRELRSHATALQVELAERQAALDRTQAEVRKTEAEIEQLRAEAEAAKIAQAEAEADTAELRQADDARKARGLLARLRAAVRGE